MGKLVYISHWALMGKPIMDTYGQANKDTPIKDACGAKIPSS